MSNAYLDNKLRTLSEKERTVLYWKCKGFNQTAIGKQIHVRKDMVKHHMACIYAKLLIQTKGRKDWRELRQILEDEYCDRVKYVVENNVDLGLPTGENILPVPPEWAIIAVEQQDKDEEEEQQDKDEEEEQQAKGEEEEEIKGGVKTLPSGEEIIQIHLPKVKPRRPWWILLLIVGVIGAYFLGRHSIGAAPAITSSPYTIQPTILVFTPTVVPTIYLQGLLPTQPPSTPVPTSTEIPEITQPPTPVEKVLFEHSFANGDSDQITKQGDYSIVGGTLSSQGPLVLTVGDDTWKDYKVDIVTRFNLCNTYGYFGVRAVSSANMIAVVGNPCQMRWVKVVNGVDNPILNTDSIPNGPQGNQPFLVEISVQGTTYQTPWIEPLTTSGYTSGKVVIKSLGGIGIDSVKVIALP